MPSIAIHRSAVLLGMLALLVLIVGLALTWHLVGMSHDGEMVMITGCLAVLATALLILRPRGADGGVRVSSPGIPDPAISSTPVAVQRPPPRGDTVLLC